MATRVPIVDDHPAVRDGLASRISRHPDLEVCGEAADVADAMKLIASTQPDVAVVDIQLKAGSGLDLVKRIKTGHREVRVLVCSVFPDKLYAKRALHAEALGYVNKEQSTSQIVDAILRVRDGRVYLSEEMADDLLSQAVGGTGAPEKDPIESLSDRELEIFQLIGEGLSTGQLAGRLHISRHTIDTHRQRIKEKLNLATAGELVRAAMQWLLEGH